MTVEDLAKIIFKELHPKLWDVQWKGFDGKLDELMEMLFCFTSLVIGSMLWSGFPGAGNLIWYSRT